MTRILDDRSIDSLFRAAHPYRHWLDKPVSDAMIEAIWELAKLPPTGSGIRPARFVFVKSAAAKAKLAPAFAAAESGAVIAAPVSAVIGYDVRLYPTPATSADALRDGTLQAGYLLLAARAIGLDCTPLVPVTPALIDAAFFADGSARTNFVCLIGHGDPAATAASEAGPDFAASCRIV